MLVSKLFSLLSVNEGAIFKGCFIFCCISGKLIRTILDCHHCVRGALCVCVSMPSSSGPRRDVEAGADELVQRVHGVHQAIQPVALYEGP